MHHQSKWLPASFYLTIVSFLSAMLLTTSALSASGETSNAKPVRDISKVRVQQRQLEEAVASRTLTWLTGSSSNNDYISVGRSANFFGFVALRVSSGHSLTRSHVARETLAVLNREQTECLTKLLEAQKVPFEQTQTARFAINRALEGLLVGEVISQSEFLKLGRAYGAAEANLGRVIGDEFGQIAQSLSVAQKSQLASIRTRHVSGQANLGANGKNAPGIKLRLSKKDKQELVNLAARFLSWTTGSPEFNDFEVVGKPSQHFGFVSLRLETNHGVKRSDVAKQILALLTPDQREFIKRSAVLNIEQFEDFLQTRGRLMRALEVALDGGSIDVELSRKLGADVGEIEAAMTWAQAQAMLDVRNSLSQEQSTLLLEMRAKYTAVDDINTSKNMIDRGRQLFAQCSLCHTEKDGAIAPNLYGIVGKNIAIDRKFAAYSPAMLAFSKSTDAWTEEKLIGFLQSPRKLIPGTTMGFSGFDNSDDARAIVEFLKQRN
jgi:cytochrome c2